MQTAIYLTFTTAVGPPFHATASMSLDHHGTKPWQKVAIRWFVLYNNEQNSPSFQPVLSNFKDIVIYLKIYLLLNIAKLAWYFDSIIYGGGCVFKQQQQSVDKNGRFFRSYD